jgi:hypothetical protein
MPSDRAIGQFPPGTWVRRPSWGIGHKARLVRSHAELAAVVEQLSPENASATASSASAVFPLLVEVFEGSVTWTDELCVADAVALDWVKVDAERTASAVRRTTKPYGR